MAKKKYDQLVYDRIIQKIESGKYLQRQHITEQEVADELEVSRTPVRKAFNQLVEEDYLEDIENVGVHVKVRPLNSRGFQNRMDFIETLLNYYLFEVEKEEVDFDVTALKEIHEKIEELPEQSEEFGEVYLSYFKKLLMYSKNNYTKQMILKTFREILFDEGYIIKIIRDSHDEIARQLLELAKYLAENNYSRARREIRILVNQLKLNVIENNQSDE